MDTKVVEKHRCIEPNAAQFLKWMRERGGLAIWGCLDLGDPGKTWTSPLNNEDGSPKEKPHWSATTQPIRVITDMEDVMVDTPLEVKRIHVALQRGSGMRIELTSGSTNRVRAALAKVGGDAWYEFDYDSQEAVIMKPHGSVTLAQWAVDHGQ